MRKDLFYLSILALLLNVIGLQKLAAQSINGTSFWSTFGNSNATISSKLGTTNSIPLRLFTKNVERIHIDTLGRVGIGTTLPAFLLQVRGTGTTIYGQSTGGYGVYGQTAAAGSFAGVFGVGTGTGVRGYGKDFGAFDSSTNSGIGVYGGSNTNLVSGRSTTGVFGRGYFGVQGIGKYIGVNGEGQEGVSGHSNVLGGDGVTGLADGGGAAYGGNFNSITSFGIFAATSNSNSYAGYFSGSVFTEGVYESSDRRLKQNIMDMANVIDIINKLQPKYYEYRQDGDYKQMNLPQGKHYGLMAQDVEQVLPGLVKETEFDVKKTFPRSATPDNPTPNSEQREMINFKALNYTELIPIMIKAMQELDKKNVELMKKTDEIDILKKKNDDLEDRLLRLEALVLNKNNTSIDLSNASLEQNTPNPFNSATIIRYHLPQSAGGAKIVITDVSGKTIKTMALTSRGVGEINLSTSALVAGSYNYTLWVDGKQVDSKKMMITN